MNLDTSHLIRRIGEAFQQHDPDAVPALACEPVRGVNPIRVRDGRTVAALRSAKGA
jgi:hypothetical protein